MPLSVDIPPAPAQPRILIAESDPTIRGRLIAALGRSCFHDSADDAVEATRGPVKCACESARGTFCWAAVSEFASIDTLSTESIDVILCSTSLHMRASADPEELHPQLERLRQRGATLVLTGPDRDDQPQLEAIRAGAMEYLPVTDAALRNLPAMIEKCIALAHIQRESERLQRDLKETLAELEFKNRELESAIDRLETLARTDELTGLANRRWLNILLEGAWAEATRHDFPLAMLMIDLDGLKRLNDQQGHPVGDEVLRLAGKVIAANTRSVDTAARYGGDEFSVLLPHTRLDQAQRVAERILRAFANAASMRPAHEPRVGMSIGVAEIDTSRPVNAAELLRHADEALYAAKSAGKRCIKVRRRDIRDRIAEIRTISGQRRRKHRASASS